VRPNAFNRKTPTLDVILNTIFIGLMITFLVSFAIALVMRF
jgi:hypothetical protein